MSKSRRKKKSPKRVLALPDLEQAKSAVLNTLTSKSSQRTYDHAITEFVEWYCSEPRLAFNRAVVPRYRINLEQKQYAPSTINLRLAAVRRIAYEAADSGLLRPELASEYPPRKGSSPVRRTSWELADRRTGSPAAGSMPCRQSTRQTRPCDARHAHRMWLPTGRVARSHDGVHSVARGALGHCGFGWQGRPHSDGSDSAVGEEGRGYVDRSGADHGRTRVPVDQ